MDHLQNRRLAQRTSNRSGLFISIPTSTSTALKLHGRHITAWMDHATLGLTEWDQFSLAAQSVSASGDDKIVAVRPARTSESVFSLDGVVSTNSLG